MSFLPSDLRLLIIQYLPNTLALNKIIDLFLIKSGASPESRHGVNKASDYIPSINDIIVGAGSGVILGTNNKYEHVPPTKVVDLNILVYLLSFLITEGFIDEGNAGLANYKTDASYLNFFFYRNNVNLRISISLPESYINQKAFGSSPYSFYLEPVKIYDQPKYEAP